MLNVLNSSSTWRSVSKAKSLIGGFKPDISMVLGSGWSKSTGIFNIRKSILYSKIDGLGKASVHGHKGCLHLATFRNLSVLIFEGRRHYYEGEGWVPVVFPSLLSRAAGASAVLLTNAAGGVSRKLSHGDVMLIKDHINLMGTNPLIGPHDARLGVRFPDMTTVYSQSMAAAMISASKSAGIKLKTGVYAALTGPTYETPAEVRSLASTGADAVGMSTVPEAIVAHACGLKVCGLSFIANMAAGIAKSPLTHEDVINSVSSAEARMSKLISCFMDRISERQEHLR